MKNLLSPEDIRWEFISSLGFVDQHHAKYINKEFGLEMETITKKLSDGISFGKSKVYYFITGQEKEYTCIQLLCDDWNEINNYDDPENEIVWIKKIVPIKKLK
ncbi:hypothetical protein [Joostella sp.]|uniref:hypothetical protein n=1 Tax=Joostella sp. TaxID=2231138 RepID=UPI003A8CB8B5